jgi:Xaa-Pro aminopeptidase
LEIHEAPPVRAGATMIMEDGMVLTVEPGVYIPGVGGVRIEDSVVVRANGCDILSRSTKELVIV